MSSAQQLATRGYNGKRRVHVLRWFLVAYDG
eukprot:SAG31_NODE_20097_length_584_cov_0.461856_1_plen_30_part_01